MQLTGLLKVKDSGVVDTMPHRHEVKSPDLHTANDLFCPEICCTELAIKSLVYFS